VIMIMVVIMTVTVMKIINVKIVMTMTCNSKEHPSSVISDIWLRANVLRLQSPR
jgi:hypothetical protein